MTPLPWHIDAVGGVHPIAYWLMHTLRGLAPKTSFWRDAQFDTLRLGLIKVAVRVTELVTKINLAADRLCLSARHRAPLEYDCTRTMRAAFSMVVKGCGDGLRQNRPDFEAEILAPTTCG